MTAKKKWTQEEDDVILRLWASMGGACADELRKVSNTHRTSRAMQHRAAKLGVYCELKTAAYRKPHARSWTAEEEALLIEVWPTMGNKCHEFFPTRSISAIENRAFVLKLRRLGHERSNVNDPEDGDIVVSKADRRRRASCYGHIPSGPAPSVFQWRP